MGSAILYGLLGIAFFVGTGYCFHFGAEWWVSICLIACGLGSLALAVYKFDEDTDLISGAIRRKRMARADQIGHRKMEIKPLHMVRMFIAAHQLRKDSNKEYLMHVAVRDIVSVYKELSKNWMLVWDERHDLINIENKKDVQNRLAEALEFLLIFLASESDDTQEIYDAYRQIFKKLRRKPILQSEIDSYCKKAFANGVSSAANHVIFFIGVTRGCIKASSYEKLVQAFCNLSLLDNTVYEHEYELIQIYFFRKEYRDVFPKTWAQFKKEY